MKAFLSRAITWLLTFFNVGVYNLSDNIDSLIMKLHFIGLHDHADTILTLSQSIEYQQSIIIVLDGLKCLFMLISLVFLFLSNQASICQSFKWIYHKINQFYSYLNQLFKPNS